MFDIVPSAFTPLRSALAGGLLAAVALAVSPAHASDGCGGAIYDHNGSSVAIDHCTDTIRYVRPRSGMRRQGARSGTLLFSGVGLDGSGRVSGTAYVFKRGCGPAGFHVSGRWRSSGLVLVGDAPVRGSGCRVTRYRRDVLNFN